MADSQRREALALSEQLLSDIEMHRMGALDIARRASRLARLLDDEAAIAWLSYETAGYPKGDLDAESSAAAYRSGRLATGENEAAKFWTESLGSLDLTVENGGAQLQALAGAPAAAGEWAMGVEASRRTERHNLRASVEQAQRLRDAIVGTLHGYVAATYQELRFGTAVETAFEVVRSEVDAAIASLVPDALPMLSAAFENSTSDNPEHWAGAAATCRRLLKVTADALRPTGPAVRVGDRSIQMGEDQYVNRLVDWIQANEASETAAEMISTDLEYLGRRLDAVNQAGSKGAHAMVTRYDASRFITGTYLLLGDIVRLYTHEDEPDSS